MTQPHLQTEYQRRPPKYWDKEVRKLDNAAQHNNLGEVFSMFCQAKATPRSKTYLIKNFNGDGYTRSA